MIDAIYVAFGAFATMIFGVLGYWINRHYNYKTKKAELDYSFFQEHKIKAIVKFFDCYSKAERMWHHFPIYRVLNKEMNDKDLDDMIWPLMNALDMSICELNLYMTENELEPFNKINALLLNSNAIVLEAYSGDSGEKNIQLGNKFFFENKKHLKQCRELLKQIGAYTKGAFVK